MDYDITDFDTRFNKGESLVYGTWDNYCVYQNLPEELQERWMEFIKNDLDFQIVLDGDEFTVDHTGFPMTTIGMTADRYEEELEDFKDEVKTALEPHFEQIREQALYM